ncbi:chromate transporter [Pseudanabaena sp. PCC 6802]|uniref:chromate transporter n=1 Tax=Pseudanabaena sp. PCC 6802 TaxID=118173 RepID=UPI000346DA38|nr:chromate transporter [Pseudanabaena sp. PCC 6802]
MSQDTEDLQPLTEPLAKRERLLELASVFGKLGIIAFGGPAAHIAMMDDEVVKRRQWMDREKLLDLLGITSLIPGPNSTELAIHIGLERAGWQGLLVAGICFILPAMLMVWALAIIYAQYRSLPEVGWLLYGVKPAIAAIVLQALWKLGRSAIKNIQTLCAGLVVAIFSFWGSNEILLLLIASLAVMLISRWRVVKSTGHNSLLFLPISANFASSVATIATSASIATSAIAPPTWIAVFFFFLKIGLVLYGSGYVLLAFLQQELVERSHWLTAQQLLDAIAIGQITPGPVFTTATFVGYLLAGHLGAIAGTIGIFLPAFVLVALVKPWATKLRRSPWASGFLDGANVASLGLMAVVTWQLGRAALVDGMTVGIVIASCIALFRFQVNSVWLVVGGGLIGLLSQLVR